MRRWPRLRLLCATFFLGLACSGTETGNPPTRTGHCDAVICQPCAPPISIEVNTVDGSTPDAVSIDGVSSVCSLDGPTWRCNLDDSVSRTPGPHSLRVSAAGYGDVGVDIVVGTASPSLCCNCGYSPATGSVTLTRE
jgi:hypothetical protein